MLKKREMMISEQDFLKQYDKVLKEVAKLEDLSIRVKPRKNKEVRQVSYVG